MFDWVRLVTQLVPKSNAIELSHTINVLIRFDFVRLGSSKFDYRTVRLVTSGNLNIYLFACYTSLKAVIFTSSGNSYPLELKGHKSRDYHNNICYSRAKITFYINYSGLH